MKAVITRDLRLQGGALVRNLEFLRFAHHSTFTPRACRPYRTQTKGKVERSVGIIKHSFWPGVCFTDLDDLNIQARAWCDQRNQQTHHTTHQRPIDRWAEEGLQPLPRGFAWERFATEERKVSWDGYLSYDGVLYGLPSEPPVAGRKPIHALSSVVLPMPLWPRMPMNSPSLTAKLTPLRIGMRP